MSPEEKLEMGRKLIAEAEAEIAAKKRNWPEKIEPGMLLRHSGGGVYIWPNERCEGLVCLVAGGKSHCGDVFCKDLARACTDSFTYLGHARDLIKIEDDAHEPTGAELVGKMCEAMGVKACHPVTAWSPTLGVTWADDDAILSGAAAWHKDARLAR